jgi:N12 class adenine-specific DNA methylase
MGMTNEKGSRYGSSQAESDRELAGSAASTNATNLWGTRRMNFYELLKSMMVGKEPEVYDLIPDPEGGRDRKRLNVTATLAAKQKMEAIEARFQEWLLEDENRRTKVERAFNDRMNSFVRPTWDGSHLTLPGKAPHLPKPTEINPTGFYKTQLAAIWRWMVSGNLYLGHGVGAGKTWIMAAMAMEARRLHRIGSRRGKRKPAIVALGNSQIKQVEQGIKQLYPAANILKVQVTSGAKAQVAMGRIAKNDWDVVLMTHDSWSSIKMSPFYEGHLLREEIDELKAVRDASEEQKDQWHVRQLSSRIKKLEKKLEKKVKGEEEQRSTIGSSRKTLYFEDLGIDMMIVDEAHEDYRDVPFATTLNNRVKGLNPSPKGDTALEFYWKTKWLNDTYKTYDNIVLASGTPLSNSRKTSGLTTSTNGARRSPGWPSTSSTSPWTTPGRACRSWCSTTSRSCSTWPSVLLTWYERTTSLATAALSGRAASRRCTCSARAKK